MQDNIVSGRTYALTSMVSVEVFQMFRSLIFESIGRSLGLKREVVTVGISEFTGHTFSIREVNCMGGLGDPACVFELTP